MKFLFLVFNSFALRIGCVDCFHLVSQFMQIRMSIDNHALKVERILSHVRFFWITFSSWQVLLHFARSRVCIVSLIWNVFLLFFYNSGESSWLSRKKRAGNKLKSEPFDLCEPRLWRNGSGKEELKRLSLNLKERDPESVTHVIVLFVTLFLFSPSPLLRSFAMGRNVASGRFECEASSSCWFFTLSRFPGYSFSFSGERAV